MAQAPDAGCALPSEPKDIPAAIDAAITGPADKDRACTKALFMPEARMMFVSIGADGTPSYTIQTLDDWIARVKAHGHAMLEEKQMKFRIERYGNIAHLWSTYTLQNDGKQVARGINFCLMRALRILRAPTLMARSLGWPVIGPWQHYWTANSDRLSHFARRMSHFLQTMVLRGISFHAP